MVSAGSGIMYRHTVIALRTYHLSSVSNLHLILGLMWVRGLGHQVLGLGLGSQVLVDITALSTLSELYQRVCHIQLQTVGDCSSVRKVIGRCGCVVPAGENGQLSYHIVAGDSERQFSVDEQSGVVTVAKPLDRETRSSYDLTIQAVDQPVDPAYGMSSSVVVSHPQSFSPLPPPCPPPPSNLLYVLYAA